VGLLYVCRLPPEGEGEKGVIFPVQDLEAWWLLRLVVVSMAMAWLGCAGLDLATRLKKESMGWDETVGLHISKLLATGYLLTG
jgi:hypothetical protein